MDNEWKLTTYNWPQLNQQRAHAGPAKIMIHRSDGAICPHQNQLSSGKLLHSYRKSPKF